MIRIKTDIITQQTGDKNTKFKSISAHQFFATLCLLLSYLFTFNAHAVGEELLADTTQSIQADIQETIITDDNSEDTANDGDANDIDSNTEDTPTPVVGTGSGTLTEKDTVIETAPDALKDHEIQKRITGIFGEIEGLNAVQVSVKEGVVSLSGEVPNEKKAKQAVNLATRVSDVVAVDDTISRTLDVQDNITPVISNLKQQVQSLIKAIPLLLVAILVFSLVAWFGSWISKRNKLWQRITPNPFVAELVSQTVKFVFIALGLIIALSFMGAESIISTLLGGAGVIGIAVGFAVKDTIENYISSILLSMRQPFRARDYVEINDHSGIVVRLTSRATILMTLEGNQLRIPNSEVFKGTITNYTQNSERRFEFELGVDANDDPIAAIKVGVDAIKTLDFILEDPKVVAIIKDVGDSNIVLTFQAWIDQTKTDLFKARSIAIREAKHALENMGFSLPEPIYKLRFSDDIESAVKNLNDSCSKLNDESTNRQNGMNNEVDDAHTTMSITPTTADNAASNMTQNTVGDVDDDTGTKNVLSLNESTKSPSDTKDKIKARARSKEILGDSDVSDVLDATPDAKLMEKVEEEIRHRSDNKDLLNEDSPQE